MSILSGLTLLLLWAVCWILPPQIIAWILKTPANELGDWIIIVAVAGMMIGTYIVVYLIPKVFRSLKQAWQYVNKFQASE